MKTSQILRYMDGPGGRRSQNGKFQVRVFLLKVNKSEQTVIYLRREWILKVLNITPLLFLCLLSWDWVWPGSPLNASIQSDQSTG